MTIEFICAIFYRTHTIILEVITYSILCNDDDMGRWACVKPHQCLISNIILLGILIKKNSTFIISACTLHKLIAFNN